MKKLFCALLAFVLMAGTGALAEEIALEVEGVGTVEFMDQCAQHLQGTLSCPDAASLAASLIPTYEGELTEGSGWCVVCTSIEQIDGVDCYGFSVGEGNEYEYVELMSAAVSPEGAVYLWNSNARSFVPVDGAGTAIPAQDTAGTAAYRLAADVQIGDFMETLSNEAAADGTYSVRHSSRDGVVLVSELAFAVDGAVGDGHMHDCALRATDNAGAVESLTWSANEAYSVNLGWPAYVLRWESGENEDMRGCSALLVEADGYAYMYSVAVSIDYEADYAEKIENAFAGAKLVAAE